MRVAGRRALLDDTPCRTTLLPGRCGGPGLGRPGGDLLSHALRRSTIGAEGFHGRVRDGIGCLTPRHGHQIVQADVRCQVSGIRYQMVPLVLLTGLARVSGIAGPGIHLIPDPCLLSSESRIKPIERLVPVSFTCCHASTPGLSTWWSSTALKRDLVLRGASRLDAFSGYPVRT